MCWNLALTRDIWGTKIQLVAFLSCQTPSVYFTNFDIIFRKRYSHKQIALMGKIWWTHKAVGFISSIRRIESDGFTFCN